MMLSLRASSKQTFSFSIHFLFYIHQFHVPSSFFFWCLVQSGLFLFLKLAFLCYSSTALAGGYSCVTLTLTLKELGLGSQRLKNLASKLHVHSVNYAAKLVHTRRALSSTIINSLQKTVSGVHPS